MMGKATILLTFFTICGCLAKPPPTFLEYKDSLGQYSFGYSAPGSARSEVRSSDGSTRGSYSYVDGSGNIQSAQYTADGENGFRIVATNLPQAPRPVEDTPEVITARLDHFKALEAASKLAKENPEDNANSINIAAKSADAADSSKISEGNADKAEVQAQVKSAEVRQSGGIIGSAESQNAHAKPANEVVISAQLKNSATSQAANSDTSMELQTAKAEQEQEILAKSSQVEDQGETGITSNKPSHDQSIEAGAEAAEPSSRTNVPVVTTSFVIPGSLDLHTKIQLDQSGEAIARIGLPEPAVSSEAQPSASQTQDGNFNPSTVTPAATKAIPLAEVKNAENLGERSSQDPAPTTSTESVDQPQVHTRTIVPAVISPANIYHVSNGLAYGIGINPLYRQYSPYHYLPYAIL